MRARITINALASFPGLLSPNAVEGLVKLLRRMTSGGRLEAWLIAPCMHNTAVHRKCHASRRPPDVILRSSFTRPSTALGDRRPGNEAINACNTSLMSSFHSRFSPVPDPPSKAASNPLYSYSVEVGEEFSFTVVRYVVCVVPSPAQCFIATQKTE